MKTVYLTIIASLFFVSAHSQEIAKDDPAAGPLRHYLAMHLRPPAIARENNIQGWVIVAFKIDDNKKITEIHIVKNLSAECDAEVVRVLNEYSQPVLLPPAEYTIAVQFLFLKKHGKHDGESTLADKSIYKNFLFDTSVVCYIN